MCQPVIEQHRYCASGTAAKTFFSEGEGDTEALIKASMTSPHGAQMVRVLLASSILG
jgi:hypothetical protein